MVEKQDVNGKSVWIRVDPLPVERQNPNIIPTEYFTATLFLQDPAGQESSGEILQEDGETKRFESPVAALAFARKELERKLA